MLFLGLGTGLGSALIVDGIVEPMEIGHLPFKKRTYEDYVGERGREARQEALARARDRGRRGADRGARARLVVLGGGNAAKLRKLPPNARLGDNATRSPAASAPGPTTGARPLPERRVSPERDADACIGDSSSGARPYGPTPTITRARVYRPTGEPVLVRIRSGLLGRRHGGRAARRLERVARPSPRRVPLGSDPDGPPRRDRRVPRCPYRGLDRHRLRGRPAVRRCRVRDSAQLGERAGRPAIEAKRQADSLKDDAHRARWRGRPCAREGRPRRRVGDAGRARRSGRNRAGRRGACRGRGCRARSSADPALTRWRSRRAHDDDARVDRADTRERGRVARSCSIRCARRPPSRALSGVALPAGYAGRSSTGCAAR